MLYQDIKSANHTAKVEKHASEIERIASAMEADDLGGDSNRGHMKILHDLASDLRANAARGLLSSAFYAAADRGGTMEVTPREIRVLAAARGQPHTFGQIVAAAKGNDAKLLSLSNLRARAARLGLDLDEHADRPLTLKAVDAALAKGPGDVDDRIRIKSELAQAGLLD